MDWNGLLNFQDDPQRNMLMQVGLGLLAGNQSGNPAMGAMRGFQNAQEMQAQMQRQKFLEDQAKMQKDEFDLRRSEYDRRIAEENAQNQAWERLGNPQSYLRTQQVTTERPVYAPIPAANGAVAPNFGMNKEMVPTTQEVQSYDESARMKDMWAIPALRNKIVEQQFTPKKFTWQDVGSEFVQLDESGNETGKRMPKSMAPKEPQIFTIKEGRTEKQYYGNMSDPSTWQLVGRSSMDAPRQPDKIGYKTQEGADGNLYYVPDRPGSPVLDVNGQPAVGFRPKTGDGKVTADERKAGTLLRRMDASLQQLREVTGVNPAAAKPETIPSLYNAITFGINPAGTNVMTSSDRQRVEAAQLDILDAALTLGTGAAYTMEQIEGYRKSYFPQLGDDPATITDKANRLDSLLQAARFAAGQDSAPAANGQQQIYLDKNATLPRPGQVREVKRGQR